MPTEYYDDDSRKKWYCSTQEKPNLEQLTFGALQRIAKATEAMAANFIALQNQLAESERSLNYWRAEAEQRRRQLAAARGQITRLKRAR